MNSIKLSIIVRFIDVFVDINEINFDKGDEIKNIFFFKIVKLNMEYNQTRKFSFYF